MLSYLKIALILCVFVFAVTNCSDKGGGPPIEIDPCDTFDYSDID
jgi:hypothetical protein